MSRAPVTTGAGWASGFTAMTDPPVSDAYVRSAFEDTTTSR
jgi:hypothetical protein